MVRLTAVVLQRFVSPVCSSAVNNQHCVQFWLLAGLTLSVCVFEMFLSHSAKDGGPCFAPLGLPLWVQSLEPAARSSTVLIASPRTRYCCSGCFGVLLRIELIYRKVGRRNAVLAVFFLG